MWRGQPALTVFLSPTQKVYLIDVREPEEVAQGAIPSAVSIPLSGFSQSIVLSETEFKEKHGFNKPQKDSQVIFYCRSGKRSASASDIARRNGYKKCVELIIRVGMPLMKRVLPIAFSTTKARGSTGPQGTASRLRDRGELYRAIKSVNEQAFNARCQFPKFVRAQTT